MITAVHTLIYSDDAEATRAFLKDVLRWPCVSDDSGQAAVDPDPAEWLIFSTGRSELGVHPTMTEEEPPGHASPRMHQITLMCDDLTATMTELASRGATFSGEPQELGFGLCVAMQVPGADDILLYEPRHATAYDLA